MSPFYGGLIIGIIIGAALALWTLWCVMKTWERKDTQMRLHLARLEEKRRREGVSVEYPKPKLPPSRNTLT